MAQTSNNSYSECVNHVSHPCNCVTLLTSYSPTFTLN